MKFFFPDSQDLVDPSFDFDKETRGVSRLRQRDDCYPHEMFKLPPYDGMLVSRAIIDERYTFPQKQRLFRKGVREFLRLGDGGHNGINILGDCGAFSYKDQEIPPFTVDDVIGFYEQCGFDLGISVDHIILDYNAAFDSSMKAPKRIVDRQTLTLEYAAEFLAKSKKSKCRFQPLGVAQGWSPKSYAHSVKKLQNMGYSYVAVGGLVPMKTVDVLTTLEAINEVRNKKTGLHLLGITRFSSITEFENYGAISFDSTSPLLQAFKSDNDNYHTHDTTYIALRVPQIEGNAKLKASILAGKTNQDLARKLERECLRLLKEFDRNRVSLDTVLNHLLAYEEIHDGRINRRDAYFRVLEDRPWKYCTCDICIKLGIHVMLFRGAERNRRRGFHNLYVFNNRLRRHHDSPYRKQATNISSTKSKMIL
jgi:queuine/archaeosine tRNA-ribosyltransferase